MFKFQLRRLVDSMELENNQAIFQAIRDSKNLARLEPDDIERIVDYGIIHSKTMPLLNLIGHVEGASLSKIIEYVAKNNISLNDCISREQYRSTILANEEEFRLNAISYNNKSLLLEIAYALSSKKEKQMGEINSLISLFLDEKRIKEESEKEEMTKLNNPRLENLMFRCDAKNICDYLLWIEPVERAHFIITMLRKEQDLTKIKQILREISKLKEEQKEKLKQEFLNAFLKIADIEIKMNLLIIYYEVFHKNELNMDLIDQIIRSNSLTHIKELMKLIGKNNQSPVCQKYQNEQNILIVANLACVTNCEETPKLRKRVLDLGNPDMVCYLIENASNQNLLSLLQMILESKGAEYYTERLTELQKNGYSRYLAMIDFVFDIHLEHLFSPITIENWKKIKAESRNQAQKLT